MYVNNTSDARVARLLKVMTDQTKRITALEEKVNTSVRLSELTLASHNSLKSDDVVK